jgi:hypothetical protein
MIPLTLVHIKNVVTGLAMYQKKLDSITVLLLVGASVIFLASATFDVDMVFASDHKNEKGSNTDNNNIVSTTSGVATQKVSDKELKNLFACISTANKGSGSLTQNDLQNCYSAVLPMISTQATANVTSNTSTSNLVTDNASPIEVSDGDTSNSAQHSAGGGSSSDNKHNHD